MNYISTRGDRQRRAPASPTSCSAAWRQTAACICRTRYPRVNADELARWRTLSYADLAFEILSQFSDDIPPKTCARSRARPTRADDRAASAAQITPLRTLGERRVLSAAGAVERPDARLQGHGDAVARQPVRVRAGASTAQTLNILGATSGDTGSAAEYAMRGKQGIRVFMLSPHKKMSAFQTAQMFSLQDANIFNIAVEGVFDDCQDIVKAVSNDLRVQGDAQDRHGQLDQLGARGGAGRVLLQRLFRGDDRTTSACRSRCRRATSATSAPATSRA